LLEIEDWTRDHIFSRSAWIHQSALKLVGAEWLDSGRVKLSKWNPAI